MAAILKDVSKHTPEFTQALTRLTLKNDAMFFIAMIYNLKHERYDPLVVRGQRTPACTDGLRICYDGELFSKDSLEDRMYTLVHEVLHVVLHHSLRIGARDPNLSNIAADYVVNGMIHEAGAFKIPKTDIQPDPAFTGLSYEQVYDLLLKEATQALAGGKKEGDGKGGRKWRRAEPGEGNPNGTGIELDGHAPHDVEKYDPSKNGDKPAHQVERENGIATEKAAQAAKAAGQGTDLVKKLLGEAHVRGEPWFSHLRRFMTVLNERIYNWGTIERRRAVLYDLVSPDQKSEAMGDIVISIDESGSLLDNQLAAIGAHCGGIFRECHPKRAIILRHTSEVTDVEIHEGPDYSDFRLERKSTGGTDFRPVFQYVAENFPEAQVLLMFTDMEGPFPEGSNIETLWISSTPESRIKTPFGERILADFND